MRRWPLLLVVFALTARADVDPATLPEAQRENFEVFRVRCSKCHTLSKPYNVRLSPEGWGRYVEKMKRRAGSGINDASGAKILSFLLWLEPRKDGVPEPPTGKDGGT